MASKTGSEKIIFINQKKKKKVCFIKEEVISLVVVHPKVINGGRKSVF